MPKPTSPFRDRTLPKVAQRLNLPEHQLRRAVNHGDVRTQSWAGVEWIEPAEEERLQALLTEVRSPLPDEPAQKRQPAKLAT